MGWHFVSNHFGVIIIGNFSTKSLIISKEAFRTYYYTSSYCGEVKLAIG